MKWNLTRLYQDQNAFQNAIKQATDLYKTIEFPLPQITEDSLFTLFELTSKLTQEQYKLSAYVYNSLALNQECQTSISNNQVLEEINISISQKFSTFSNFILENKDVIAKIIKLPEFAPYQNTYNEIIRNSKHLLSDESESLLSSLSYCFQDHAESYNLLESCDMVTPIIQLNGIPTLIDYPFYSNTLTYEEDHHTRLEVYKAFKGNYLNHKTSFSSLYRSLLTSSNAYSKVRNHEDALSASLNSYNIPRECYLTLIKSYKKSTSSIQKYHKHRAKKLNLDNYTFADTGFPIENCNLKIPYEQAKELVRNSFKQLSQEIVDIYDIVTAPGNIDVYPTSTKQTGGYSYYVYGVGEFMLLNHNDDIDSLFTLAHEAGHAIHSHLSAKHQHFENSNYSLFIAEIASTFSEYLLYNYLLTHSLFQTTELQQYLHSHLIDSYLNTYYRQAMLADYEYITMEMVKNNFPITFDSLSTTVKHLHDTLYSDSIKFLEEDKSLIGYIPHFFRTPFYVYQYATSFAASSILYSRFLENPEQVTKDFIELLSSGSIDYPINLLKDINIDFTNESVFEYVKNNFERVVDKYTQN